MSSYTDNLNLYEKDPDTDGSDTFNIQTMMNDNWDKIDDAFEMDSAPTSGSTNLVNSGAVYTALAEKAPIDAGIRPNLLDNWYFGGGGSQATTGAFPINQRGASSYSGDAVYTIDRWITLGSASSITINSDCVTVASSSSSANGRLTQWIDPGILDSLAGQTCTLSLLLDSFPSATGAVFIFIWNNTVISQVSIPTSGDKLLSTSFTVPTTGYGSTAIYQRVQVSSYLDSASVNMKAMKLELGDTQTLAHYDDDAGEWVLNEIPNFAEELMKCQRYYWRVRGDSLSAIYIGYAQAYSSTDAIIILPHNMRNSTPSVAYYSATELTLTKTTQAAGIATTAIASATFNSKQAALQLTVASGLTAGDVYMVIMKQGSSNYLALTSDL